MQNLIIILIIAICAVLIGRRFYRNLRSTSDAGSCGCGCTGCGPDLASTCETKPPEEK
jgi:hypothetical protein